MKTNFKEIKIAIADDHVLFGQGLASLIDSVEGMRVVHIAENGLELLKGIKAKGMPDVILLDIEMPVMDGFQTLKELLKINPSVRVIAFSMHKEYSFISKMILSGTCGYLIKNAQPEEVINAIKTVADGGLSFNQEATAVMMNMIYTKDKTKLSRIDFTERELEIIELLCKEKSTTEIAEILCVSRSTVEFHKHSIFEKMETKSLVGMAVYAIQNKII
jgi:DNA-binding NarL/FixJ family response regulator